MKLKFYTEVRNNSGEVMASFGPGAPKPQGGGGHGVVLDISTAQIGSFSENSIEQKLQNAP